MLANPSVKNPFIDEEVRIGFNRQLGKFELATEIELACPIEEVFAFFSDAANLQRITPPWLNFQIVTELPVTMKKGQVLDYQLRLHGVPIKWKSEICIWEPNKRFVDQQLSGPYGSWWHEHTFFDLGGTETLMRDRVRYTVPGGRMIHRLLVKNDLRKIFEFRREVIQKIFSDEAESTPELDSCSEC